MLGLSRVGVVVATLVAIACEVVLCERAGIAREAYVQALVLVMVMAAVAATFVGHQVLGLVHDVSREQARRVGRQAALQRPADAGQDQTEEQTL